MSVSFECYVLAGRCVRFGLITRAEKSYRVYVCVYVCVCVCVWWGGGGKVGKAPIRRVSGPTGGFSLRGGGT